MLCLACNFCIPLPVLCGLGLSIPPQIQFSKRCKCNVYVVNNIFNTELEIYFDEKDYSADERDITRISLSHNDGKPNMLAIMFCINKSIQ